MSILLHYAPTNNAEEEDQERVYPSLKTEVEKISRHDLFNIVEVSMQKQDQKSYGVSNFFHSNTQL